MVLLSTVKTRSRSTFDSLYAFASFTYFKIPASRSSATTITATETIANLRLFFISKLYQTYAVYAIFFYKIRTAGHIAVWPVITGQSLIYRFYMLPVVDQMQIHRIVGTDGIVGSNCICNFTMSFDSFISHREFCRLTDQRN